MGGFSNISNGLGSVLNANNGSFDGTIQGGILVADGQFWIGATALNAGLTHINVGTITSTTLTVGFSSPNITINTSGGGVAVDRFGVDTGTTPVLATAGGLTNILGLSGSKTVGSTNTITIKSPPFSQVGASGTSSLNSGEFVTAAVTRTLPASAGLADGDLFIFVRTTNNALIIQAVSAQKIRIGNQLSVAAGTITSTAIGDSVSLRFNATDGFFYAVSSIGNWTIV